jgi:hypothetical protein
MNTIEFSYNWNNKLNCKYFTTLRLSNRLTVGEWVLVYEKNKCMGLHKVEDKKQLSVKSLNPWICGIDTGYTVEETKRILEKMYPGKITDETTIYWHLLRKPTKEEQAQFENLEKQKQGNLLESAGTEPPDSSHKNEVLQP